jgi:hypothetical protein
MYKIYSNRESTPVGVIRSTDGASIPFDPANTDYQTFKQDVLEGAELQDADGNVMTPQDATSFIATLP